MKMLKRISQIIVIIGIGYFLISYSTQNKKYKILNQVFSDLEFNPENICKIEENIDFDKEIFNELSFYDIPSGYAQFVFKNVKAFLEMDPKIQSNKMDVGKVITDCSTDKKMIKSDDKSERWKINSNIQISLPILSIDKSIAIIQIRTNCGMLCGETTLYAFKKSNGKWKVSNEKMLRIS